MPDPGWPRCIRCRKLVHPDRLIKGFGRDCASYHGLIGATRNTGHHGPDLLDLLSPASSTDTRSPGWQDPGVTETNLTWRKSSRCGTTTCVEIARDGDDYLMRDSKNPDTAPLRFTADEWAAFVDGVTAGEFRFTS